MATNDAKIAARIIAKAWADDEYRSRLLAKPAEVLAAEGLDVAPDVQVITLSPDSAITHFFLPEKPTDLGAEALNDDGVAKEVCYQICEACGCFSIR